LKDKESAPLSLVEVFTTSLHSYLELRETWLVFLVTLAILTAITLLILIFLRSRIRIAIALISYGSK
jgi:solute carrier family 44 (choline transporter-like protein), member 2/4/5